MPLEINLNTPPYFDDFNENNDFHRILFRPSTAVQARELTQLQSILQNQVEKFGKHIFVDGSVIEGCALYFDNKYSYVKILDNYSNGAAIGTLSVFADKKLYSPNTLLEAVILTSVTGFEAASPDLNTLYIKYTNAGTYANGVPQKKFDPNQAIQVRTIANTLYGTITVGNSSINSVGEGYALGVSEGVIFQKGFFVRVDPQTVIVSKYNNIPTGVSVGFNTVETIVTSDSDSTLLDNALGAPNYNAPGANRLKLTANLVVRTTDNTSVTAATANTDNFFSIAAFEDGVPVTVSTDPQYAQLGRQLAKRTYEESGNYILDPFELSISANTSNNNYHSLAVDRGVGYVTGYRVEFLNKKVTPIRKGTDTARVANQIIGTGYGNYVLANNVAGTFDIGNLARVSLRDTVATAVTSGTFSATSVPGTEIGTAYVRAIALDSGTPGTAAAVYRIYLYNINMAATKNFNSVRSIYYGTGTVAFADVYTEASSAVLYDNNIESLVFPLGRRAIANTSDRSYTTTQIRKSVNFTGGVATGMTPLGTNTVFATTGTLTTQQRENFIIIPKANTSATIAGKPVLATAITATSSSATITTGLANTFTADVLYNVTRQNTGPAGKTITTSVFTRIQANTHPKTVNGPWTLGIPDVFRLRAVYQGGSTTSTNITSNFVLDNGQRDSYYDVSYLKLKPGTSFTVGADDILLVEYDCFRADTTTGSGFFTVDSYPVDNSATPAANTITTAEIPRFISASGQTIDLRDSVDFRPQFVNTAAYAITNSASTINPVVSNTFSLPAVIGIAEIPVPDDTASLTFNYYVGRKDKVTLTPSGRVNIIEGIPSIFPLVPKDQEGAMTLGTIDVPPFPSLTQAQSKTALRYDYLITSNLQQQRRYTMRDVGVLDRRINTLEYYTLLSALEVETDKLLITDTSGNDRFKNGIFVDSFNDFKIADTASLEFKAAIDTKRSVLRPKFSQAYIPLVEKSFTNVTKKGTTSLFSYTHVPFIEQPFASKVRNCAEALVYVWKGSVQLVPEGDHVPDVKYNPDINIEIDLAKPFLELQQAGYFGAQYGHWQTSSFSTAATSTSNITNQSINDVGGFDAFDNRTTTLTTTANQVRSVINTNFSSFNQTFNFGEIVQDVSVLPFMRSRRITFAASGLKPGSRVYPFFDDISITQYCRPGTLSSGIIIDTGTLGDTFIVSSVGAVYGVFYLPENTFKTGERILKLVDVQNLVTEAATISTIATGSYTGSNILIAKANARVSTTTPQITQTITQESQAVVVDQQTVTETNFLYRHDPIAQSFLIDDVTTGIPGVYITKIDLFFQQKDSVLGVEVQVREVDENTGYPTPRIVPYGRKIIASADINTSAVGSTATTVEFDSPLYLENQRQYCFVVLPIGNNTNTKIWVAEIGGTDEVTGASIYTNNPMGDLFTSSTNRTWTVYTKEDIKCVVYRAAFSASTGTVTYRNADVEYLTVGNFKNTFLTGETVYVSNGTPTVASNGSVTTGSNTVYTTNGTPSAITTFATNSLVYISSNTGSNSIVRTVVSGNATHLTLNGAAPFTDANVSIGKLFSGGGLNAIVEFVDPTNNELYLVNSTANAVSNFTNVATGNTYLVIGNVSGARANVVSVDDVWYSAAVPQLSVARPAGTFAGLSFNGTNAVDSPVREGSSISVQNDIEIEFVDLERRVLSRSREFSLMSGNNSLELTATLSSTDSKLSPIISDIKKSVLIIKNEISNTASASAEYIPGGGLATSKYVSRRVILAEGQDAEDLQVYLTANKPSGTDILVYAKLLGAEDSEAFDNKNWTLMEQVTPASVVGSKVNFTDYREYQYQFPTGTNATTTTTAFRNTNNTGIVRYYTIAGAPVDNFKTFAIKIVMISEPGTHLIPRIADMRAIALQV